MRNFLKETAADAALHHLVAWVGKSLIAKDYAQGTFVDIKRAFDSASHSAIEDSMYKD